MCIPSLSLFQEPELLKADGDRVKRQMQEVAVSHYRAFITAAQAVQLIRSEISAIDHHLGSLVRHRNGEMSDRVSFKNTLQHDRPPL